MIQQFSPGLLRQLYQTIQRVRQQVRNAEARAQRIDRHGYSQGYIVDAIPAATDSKTAPATGTVDVFVRDNTTNELIPLLDASAHPVVVNVVNRTDIPAEAGAYCHVRVVGGEWQYVVLNCKAETP